MRLIDETGHVYGNLTVISRAENVGKNTAWLCKCACGATEVIRGQDLRDGIRLACKRCTPTRRDEAYKRTDGRRQRRGDPTYTSWQAMHRRCENQKNANYKYYGGRGVHVCARWSGDGGFAHFLADMGPRPAGCTLDRVNTAGDYEPGNCRWANRQVQAGNRPGFTHELTVNGETHVYAEWERLRGLTPGTVAQRIARGATADRALTNVDLRQCVMRQRYAMFAGDVVADDNRVGTRVGSYVAVNVLVDGDVLWRCTVCGHHVRGKVDGTCPACVARWTRWERAHALRLTAANKAAAAELRWALGTNELDRKLLIMFGARPVNAVADASYDGRWRVVENARVAWQCGRTVVSVNNHVVNLTTLVPGDTEALLVNVKELPKFGPRLVDETAHEYGRLTVVNYMGVDQYGHAVWRCRCACGAITAVDAGHLRSGATTSCGCMARERTSAVRTKHGLANTGTWTSYMSMHARCEKPQHVSYANYGGRGIKVCARWSGDDGFINFVADLGVRPDDMTLDRIDVNGDYEPSNCRWADGKTQRANRRDSVEKEYKSECYLSGRQ